LLFGGIIANKKLLHQVCYIVYSCKFIRHHRYNIKN